MLRRVAVSVAAPLLALFFASALPLAQQTSARDSPAQPGASPSQPSARISGRVLTADTGRHVSRVRVVARSSELPGGRALLTDDSGQFDLVGLPAGRYILSASKTGFVDLAYGQRRPLLPGTPLQLTDGEHLTGLQFRLPRGSVVSGHVFDETSEPLPGTVVRVLRFEYAQGNRSLVPAGAGQTDDRGEFRVWGLNPGEYYVSAVARNPTLRGRGPAAFPGRPGRGRIEMTNPAGSSELEESAYAPTYYPGVSEPAEAQSVVVGLSAEVLNVDFVLHLVPTATVAGRVLAADPGELSRARVTLTPDAPVGRRAAGATYGTRVPADGGFSIRNVPPGRYVLRARADGETPLYAQQPVLVDGSDVTGLVVSLGPGASIGGTVRFEPTPSTTVPQVGEVRVSVSISDADPLGPTASIRPAPDGTFNLDGVPPGAHWIRARAPAGWMLKSVLVNGRDLVDEPVELRTGQSIDDVALVFSGRAAGVTGAVTDERGEPLSDYTVLVFPTDPRLWHPQARQIATARPDQDGRFEVGGLPDGEYFVTIIDPIEPGEWFDPSYLDRHRQAAERLRLVEGGLATQDFRLPTR